MLLSFCACHLASSCRNSYIIILCNIYILLILQLYNCTKIYIAKYGQCIAFRIIYIAEFFLWLMREKATNRPQKVTQVAVCCRSEQHTVFIGCLYQHCPYRTRNRSDANRGKRAVSFAAALVCGFPTFNLRSTAENNGQE